MPTDCECFAAENGAGKSTFIKILGGVYKRDGGNILWNGKDLPEAIRTARPWGVDLSSGVETGGFKDFQKICAAVRAARKD